MHRQNRLATYSHKCDWYASKRGVRDQATQHQTQHRTPPGSTLGVIPARTTAAPGCTRSLLSASPNGTSQEATQARLALDCGVGPTSPGQVHATSRQPDKCSIGSARRAGSSHSIGPAAASNRSCHTARTCGSSKNRKQTGFGRKSLSRRWQKCGHGLAHSLVECCSVVGSKYRLILEDVRFLPFRGAVRKRCTSRASCATSRPGGLPARGCPQGRHPKASTQPDKPKRGPFGFCGACQALPNQRNGRRLAGSNRMVAPGKDLLPLPGPFRLTVTSSYQANTSNKNIANAVLDGTPSTCYPLVIPAGNRRFTGRSPEQVEDNKEAGRTRGILADRACSPLTNPHRSGADPLGGPL